MDKAEMKHLEEMQRLADAIDKTHSQKLKNDYQKALKRMMIELQEYHRLKSK